MATLRARKGRGDKPFAIMAPTMEAVRSLCEVSADEAVQLQSRARPIVLLRRRAGVEAGAAVSRLVAPGPDRLGVMLLYSQPLVEQTEPRIPRPACGRSRPPRPSTDDERDGRQTDA